MAGDPAHVNYVDLDTSPSSCGTTDSCPGVQPYAGSFRYDTHTFTNTGTFDYRCKIHGGMTGTVTVVASGSSDAVTVTTPGMTFSPSTVTINNGGTVTWDISGTTHTVTRP